MGICIIFNISIHAFAFNNMTSKAKVKPITESMAKKLIRNHKGKIYLNGLKKNDDIIPEQFFEIKTKSNFFYIISAHRYTPSDDNLSTCSVLLIDQNGIIKTSFDTMGNDDEKRSWYCDCVEAMSFKDYYSNGDLKIIGIYRGTAPSSEKFVIPVIMKLDFNNLTLKIDEELTNKLEDADVKTIQGVRSYLKKLGMK